MTNRSKRAQTAACPACGQQAVLCLDRHEVWLDGRVYRDDLPAARCDACRTTHWTDDAVLRFEADLAASLLMHGARSPEVQAFIQRYF